MKKINYILIIAILITLVSCSKEDKNNSSSKITPEYTYLDTCVGNGATNYLKYYEDNLSGAALIKTGNYFVYANDAIMKFNPVNGNVEYRTYKSWVRGAIGDSLGNLYFTAPTIISGSAYNCIFMFNLWSGTEIKIPLPSQQLYKNFCVNNDTNWVFWANKSVTIYKKNFTPIKTINLNEDVLGIKFKNNKFYILTNDKIFIYNKNLDSLSTINLNEAYYSTTGLMWKISDDGKNYLAINKATGVGDVNSLELDIYYNNGSIQKSISFPESLTWANDFSIGANNEIAICGRQEYRFYSKTSKRSIEHISNKGMFCVTDNDYKINVFKTYDASKVPATEMKSIEAFNNDYLICGETNGFSGKDRVQLKKVFIAKVDANGNYCK